jgi:hypothetical protein
MQMVPCRARTHNPYGAERNLICQMRGTYEAMEGNA